MTPRRLILLVAAVGCFVGAFLAYNRLLGSINGLPPLPPAYLAHRTGSAVHPPPQESRETRVARRLVQAFGPDCPELSYPIQLDLPARGLVLAAGEMKPVDGRALLFPMSLVVYGKPATAGGPPTELSTIHCDQAWLTFEKPVHSITEMGRSRIVAIELLSNQELAADDPRRGLVHVVHRRLPSGGDQPQDSGEIVLRTPGPVYYQEQPADSPKPQIWTISTVDVTDRRGDGPPTTISATGLDVYLAHESTKKGERKPGSTGYSGAQRLDLGANVTMHFWEDARSGFLSAPPKKPAPAAKGKAAPPRSSVVVTTLGPFHYDLTTDVARFDILPQAPPNLRNFVEVDRESPSETPNQALHDRLYCDFLELHFQRDKPGAAAKPKAAAKPSGPPAAVTQPQEMEVVSAHAWGRRITLSSDAEKLIAHGSDLVYDARTRETTLKGEPNMTALKDGNVITAPQVVMRRPPPEGVDTPPPPKTSEQARASGPGRLETHDLTTGKVSRRATWQRELVVSKDDKFDVMTLTGGATFDDVSDPDPARHQQLKADELKVWMYPDESAAPAVSVKPTAKPKAKPKAGAAAADDPTLSHKKLHKLLAVGHVESVAPTLLVHDTDQLTLHFQDSPPTPAPVAAPAPAPAPLVPVPVPMGQPAVVASGPPKPDPPPKKPSPPYLVSARTVEAFVLNTGTQKYEMDRVVCDGAVRVHQDPEQPGDPPTDLRGRHLVMTRVPGTNLNVLVVLGTAQRPAEVRLPRLAMLGPDVTIDQQQNETKILGAGSLTMLSASDFQGKAKERPTPLTITWTHDMLFQGQHAMFTGGVGAEQDGATLQCETLQVFLDRPVNLSQMKASDGPVGIVAQPMGTAKPTTTAEKEPAKVERVICDAANGRLPVVTLTKKVYAEGRLQEAQRIEAPVVTIDNVNKILTAIPGGASGLVSLLRKGVRDPSAQTVPGTRPVAHPAVPRRPGAAANPRDEIMKLTRVRFLDSMQADDVHRLITFLGKVELWHFPSESLDPPVNLEQLVNKLPEGGMYLQCDKLVIYTEKVSETVSYQQATATGHARILTPEILGLADAIKYDEQRGSVTLVGTPTNPAQLSYLKNGQAGTFHGQRITYRRVNGQDLIDADGLNRMIGSQ